VTFWQTAIYIVYKLSLNYPSFKAIAGCPLDSSSSRTARQHTRSGQRRTAHRTGCGLIVQISSPKTSGLQIRRIWTQWTIVCGVQCWKPTASLKQSRRQSLNSSKRFKLSGAACHRDRSTNLWKTSQSDWRLVLELAVDTSNIRSDNGILAFDH